MPVAESVQAHQALQALGAPSDLLLLPGEGHTIVGREHLVELERARRRLVRSLAVSSRTPSPTTPHPPPTRRSPRTAGSGTATPRSDRSLRELGHGGPDRRRDGAGRPSTRPAVCRWRPGPTAGRPCSPSRSTRCPRVLPSADWTRIAAGVEQRHRALNAFLADAYRAAGRRRGDVDRAPEVVRAGVLPEWAVAHSPGRDPDAVGQAWPGQPRATVAAADVASARPTGEWVVTADHLRVPAGLGYALAARDTVAPRVPGAARGRGGTSWIRGTPCRCSARAWPTRRRRRAPGRRRSPSSPPGRATTPGSSTACWPTRSGCRWCGPATSGPARTAASRPRSTASASRSTSCTGGSTTGCSAPTGRRSASRWTCC